MKSSEYPRILLVSASVFNPYSGGGITLTNLFRGWPTDKIATVHSDAIIPDERVCRRFYKLGKQEYLWLWPLSLMLRMRSREQMAPATQQEATRSSSNNGARHVARRLWHAGARLLGGEELLRAVRVSDALKTWVEEFRPHLIYTLLGSLMYIRLVQKLSDVFSVPIAFHIMDDWPATRYRRGVFAPYLRATMEREFQALIDQAALRMGICQSMCRAYEKRYGYQFIPFHNTLDISAWLPATRQAWEIGDPIRVVYAGSIVPSATLDSLRDVSDAVAGLREAGMNIEMRMHVPWFYADRCRKDLERPPGVLMADPPEDDTIISLFAGADLLVLPVNFDDESVQYIRYSMPTKVPAYMISGTPVLVYGPPEAASVSYAQEGGWGYIVPRRGVAGVKEAIRRLVADQDLRARLGRRAQALARQNHDANIVRPAFHRALAEAARRND